MKELATFRVTFGAVRHILRGMLTKARKPRPTDPTQELFPVVAFVGAAVERMKSASDLEACVELLCPLPSPRASSFA